jgi:hypothetical protein
MIYRKVFKVEHEEYEFIVDGKYYLHFRPLISYPVNMFGDTEPFSLTKKNKNAVAILRAVMVAAKEYVFEHLPYMFAMGSFFDKTEKRSHLYRRLALKCGFESHYNHVIDRNSIYFYRKK